MKLWSRCVYVRMATDVHRWTCDIYFIASLLCEWVCLRDGECFLKKKKKKGCGTKSNKSNILDILFVESSKPFMSLISAFVIFLI